MNDDRLLIDVWLNSAVHARSLVLFPTKFESIDSFSFCGTRKPPILTSQGNVMTVNFVSDVSGRREGFVASYLFLDASKTCGGHFVKPNGAIKTPNYPQPYPSRRECTWVIEAANKHRVILTVKDFDVEYHSSCTFDYLEIR